MSKSMSRPSSRSSLRGSMSSPAPGSTGDEPSKNYEAPAIRNWLTVILLCSCVA